MATPMIAVRPKTKLPAAALGKLTAVAMAGIAGMLGYVQAAVLGGFEPIVTGIAVILLVIAGVIAGGRRWTPALGAVVCGLLLALAALGGSEVVYMLSHPGDKMFALVAILLPLLVIGFASGIAATLQNYRSVERKTPRHLATSVAVVAGVVAGAILVSSITQSGGSVVSPETLNALPGVTIDKYENGQIHVKAGQLVALRLENPDPVGHSFDVDELGVHSAMPSGKNSLALFQTAKPGTYTFYCAPHYNKATGEGMHGTLVVEQ